ncbi:MAG: hypothetical protein IJJ26_00295 [Victivallales bacterium]|nr:hypothetical protein [Victivallales bacterium]
MSEFELQRRGQLELLHSLSDYFNVPLDQDRAVEGQAYATKLLSDLLVSFEALGGMMERSYDKPDTVDFMFALDTLAMVSKRLKSRWLNFEIMLLYDASHEEVPEKRRAAIERFLDQVQILRSIS